MPTFGTIKTLGADIRNNQNVRSPAVVDSTIFLQPYNQTSNCSKFGHLLFQGTYHIPLLHRMLLLTHSTCPCAYTLFLLYQQSSEGLHALVEPKNTVHLSDRFSSLILIRTYGTVVLKRTCGRGFHHSKQSNHKMTIYNDLVSNYQMMDPNHNEVQRHGPVVAAK